MDQEDIKTWLMKYVSSLKDDITTIKKRDLLNEFLKNTNYGDNSIVSNSFWKYLAKIEGFVDARKRNNKKKEHIYVINKKVVLDFLNNPTEKQSLEEKLKDFVKTEIESLKKELINSLGVQDLS